jgi:hypothetical protein
MIERTIEEITRGSVFALLPDETQAQIRALSPEEVRAGAERALARPMTGPTSQSSRLLMNPSLAVQWLAVFEELGLPRRLSVYEPCAGGSEPALLALEIYSGGAGEYTTVNLNRILAGQLRGKIGKLRSKIRIIEDDATTGGDWLPPRSVDVACFHHAINDLLQTAVAEPRGMDTRAIEWWSNERQMIEWLAEEHRAGQLGERAQPALLAAVRYAVERVKRVPSGRGWLLFDHWTWDGHKAQEWFPWELFCDLIPMAREWITEAGLPLRERPLPGLEPRWWMALQVPGS